MSSERNTSVLLVQQCSVYLFWAVVEQEEMLLKWFYGSSSSWFCWAGEVSFEFDYTLLKTFWCVLFLLYTQCIFNSDLCNFALSLIRKQRCHCPDKPIHRRHVQSNLWPVARVWPLGLLSVTCCVGLKPIDRPCFVFADGKLDVFQHNKLLTSIAVWTTFGELAILYNCTRTASVRGNWRQTQTDGG